MPMSRTETDVTAQIRRLRILPVIVIDDPGRAEPLAAALVEGGLPCAEVTFRTAAAAEALERMAAAGSSLLVGAGTVLTRDQAARALDAGAAFVVSPGFDRNVVDFCVERGVAVYPGVCTPSEVQAGVSAGLGVLKFFPAEPMGGLPFLEAVAAPFPRVEFIPTGGIDASRLPAYLSWPRVLACGGSWVARRAWIEAGEFDRIRAEAERAVATAATITGGAA